MARDIRKLVLLLGLLSFLNIGMCNSAWAGKGHDHKNEAEHKQSKQSKHAPHKEHGGKAGHKEHGGDAGHHESRLRIGGKAQTAAGFKRAKVEIREIKSYIKATGRIDLNHNVTAQIIPRIPGRIYKVLGNLGDKVKKGDALLIIDSLEMSKAKSDFQVNKSALALAESNFEREKKLYETKIQILEVLKKDLSVQKTLEALKDAELGEAKGKILTAMTDLELADDVYKREKDLLDGGIGVKKEFIKAEKSLTNARINLESVLEDIKIDAYRTFVKFQSEHITAKSEFGEAEERLYLYGLSDSKIAKIDTVSGIERALFPLVAPFEGTIVQKHVTLGEMVGDESLYTLSDLSKLWVIIDIYESDLARIKVGQRVLIGVDAYKERLFPGELFYISELMDEQSRTVKARVVVDNRQRLLKPGMFTQASIEVGTGSHALCVPSTAVQSKGKESMVFVVRGSDKFAKRIVKLGSRDKEYVTILKGLKEGEMVVTEGSFLLKSELSREEVESSHGHSH